MPLNMRTRIFFRNPCVITAIIRLKTKADRRERT